MNSNDTLHAGLLAASVLGFVAIASIGTAPVRAGELVDNQLLVHEDVHVSYVRKDLSDPNAAGMLYNELRHASSKVCGKSFSRSDDLESFARYQACYRQTLHDAVKQVNAPALLAIYTGNGKVARG